MKNITTQSSSLRTASFKVDNKVFPQIQIIKAEQINDAWTKVMNKEARYRYVIDAATF